MKENILELIKNSAYKLNQFTSNEIFYIRKEIFTKIDKKGREVPYINCQVRKKDIMLTPEELVRQLYIYKLNSQYEYPYAKMQVEYPVSFGREKKGRYCSFQ